MDIYVTMVLGRHDDPEASLFSTVDAALAAARQSATRLGLVEDAELPDGWLYFALHRTESDAVWVVKKVLDAGT